MSSMVCAVLALLIGLVPLRQVEEVNRQDNLTQG
jgi:hypothetical protein